ncbi:ATP-binding cassette domain-containing protein [Paracoccus sp. N5]|uniref:ABC transporter ATP-binding protein n=1 Tax=Paracoccus sp. N5 TaxID=1101189 RepID=UPI00039E567B|nr:ATP-binding cassette domain-containing protein [Paracoccus sp. N5]
MTAPALHMTGVEVRFPGLGSPALAVPELRIAAGAMVAVAGPSGSGKSTLVNVLTGLERPAHGAVRWGGTDIAALSEGARDRWRGAHVGLVMQDFHLFPGLSALDNVLLPARMARAADRALVARAADLLAGMGLDRPRQRIETMSRGEMQRVAIARALLRRPGIIVADEPTASLDATTGEVIAGLLIGLARDSGATLIVVTHDPALVQRLPRRIALARGRVVAADLAEAA